ncbi:DUF1573 domain-containing protein [Cyclobacterium sp. 1_MG-2023]|uniref:DUF1573 domain-containing protein n=1 Tax=Cyclobacterium sp. 1_MG-2023 TaxID=3062681 RepID=UPI0026E17AEB|nr:DUF1573 domain-containing protein [Cyclobacterium sp. 1_MG-2023]MDO6438816.1 DUF1573 domain-containing protein [Cyclobacterium sp. 1_MG-2023]
MKYSNLSVWLLGLTLIMAGACGEKGSGNDDKIQELEQKISQLEQNQVVTPSTAQNVQPADPATVGAFGFEEEIFDFGTIDEGKVVEHVFKFKNEGQVPLIISNIQASCGCTSPEWSKEPVKPGDEGFIKVVFNSRGKSGVQSPTVTIQANTSPSVTRLRLKGTVNRSTGTSTTPSAGPVKR